MSYVKEVLELLQSKKVVKCYELVKITHRFGACIWLLRHKYGVDIKLHPATTVTLPNGRTQKHTRYELIQKEGENLEI